MTATVAQARQAMMDHVETSLAAGAPTAGVLVLWPDRPGEKPSTEVPYMRVGLKHNAGAGGQVMPSNADGQRRYRSFGLVTVQIYTLTGDGYTVADTFVAVVKATFEGVRLAPSGVVFHRVRLQEIGPRDLWTQTNVIAEFEYDEVR